MEKIFNQKNFNYFVWTPLGSRVSIYIYIFAFKFTFRYLQPDTVPIVCHRCRWYRWQICRRYRWYRWQFATGVVDTGGKFAASIVDTGGNLPPASLTPVAICHRHVSLIPVAICRRRRWHQWQFATGVVDTSGKFAAGIVDTGGKFATGINNTSKNGGKICRWCRWHRWKICHRCRWYWWCTLTYEYLREFSKKFEMVLMGYSAAGGTDSWKKPEAKNLVTLSL